jgi:hypothetical protein
MTRDSSKPLLLTALLKGLAHAVQRDDLSAAERYCQRLQLTAETITPDAQVKGVLAKLFVMNGLWVRSADVERGETRQQLLELVDHVLEVLTGGSISSARSLSRATKMRNPGSYGQR